MHGIGWGGWVGGLLCPGMDGYLQDVLAKT